MAASQNPRSPSGSPDHDRRSGKHTTQAQPPGDTSRSESVLQQVRQLIEQGQPDEALHILSRGSATGDAIRNARGVCLLRLGRCREAVELFRGLALAANSTWLREDQPVVYRTNLCLALLLDGHPAGAIELLDSMAEQDHPLVQRLHRTIRAWKRSLSLWQRLKWMGGVDPGRPVSVDFPPGDFDDRFDPSGAPDRPSRAA